MDSEEKNQINTYRAWLEWIVRGMVASILVIAWQVKEKQVDLIASQNSLQSQVDALRIKNSELYAEIKLTQSQMVGWDVVTRIERGLAAMAALGKGNDAMGVMANVLKSEIESRKAKQNGQ